MNQRPSGYEPDELPTALLRDIGNQRLLKWRKVDSNHRRQCQQIYSLSPLATREFLHKANDRTRTDNLLITSQLLCQLSHVGASLVSSKRRENGHYRARTYDILLVRQALSQLS